MLFLLGRAAYVYFSFSLGEAFFFGPKVDFVVGKKKWLAAR